MKSKELIISSLFIGLGLTTIEFISIYSLKDFSTISALFIYVAFSLFNGFIFVTAMGNENKINKLEYKLLNRNTDLISANKKIYDLEKKLKEVYGQV